MISKSATSLWQEIRALCLPEAAPGSPLLFVSATPLGRLDGGDGPLLKQVTPDEIEAGRTDLAGCRVAIVIDQLEHLSPGAGMQMLSRLRDCYCDLIIVHTSLPAPTAQEMLSIGFYPEQRWEGKGRLFRYCREEFYAGREWNTPEHWANPANFGKYRW